LQVGAFRDPRNAARVFDTLRANGFTPEYKTSEGFYRVVVSGVKTAEISIYTEKLRSIGFYDIFVRRGLL
jgi:cell division protein FtsN